MIELSEIEKVFGKVVEDSKSSLDETIEKYDDDMYERAAECFNSTSSIEGFKEEFKKAFPDILDDDINDIYGRFDSLVLEFKERVE